MKSGQTYFKGLDRSIRMQKIVEAATRLFHRQGFQATTLDEVAKELHLTKSALYHYIPGKGKLLEIIYNQAFDKIFHRIYEIAAQNLYPAEKLRLIIRDHICHIITSNIAMFSVFFAEESQLPAKDFQKIRAEKRKYTRLVVTIIEEGIATGQFKPVNPRLMAFAILGMCNWIYQWYKQDRAAFTPEQIADQFITLLESGYLADRQGSAIRQQRGVVGEETETYRELKMLCEKLSDLVERLGP